MGNRIVRSDLDGLVSKTVTPIAIYVPGDMLIVQTRDDLRRMVGARVTATMTEDVTRVTAKIIEVDQKTDRRAAVLAQWEFWSADNVVLKSDLVRYMVSQGREGGDLKVEIVDFIWVSQKDLVQTLIRKNMPQNTAGGDKTPL